MASAIINNICRLCAKHGNNYHPIFDKKKNSIAEKIHNCLPIVINSNDQLPVHICNPCLEALETSDKLRAQCLEADSILRKQLIIDPIVENIKQENDLFYIECGTEPLDTDDKEFNACNEDSNVSESSRMCESEPDNLLHHKHDQHDNKNKTDGKAKKSKDLDNSNRLIEDKPIENSIIIKEEIILPSDDISITTDEKEKTDCDICKITIKEKKLMENHIKFHQPRPMFCVRCYRTLPSPYELYLHKKAVHKVSVNVQLKWFCETCERMTDRRELALEHMHQCITPRFPCEYCSLQFTFKSELVTHRKKNHMKLIMKDPKVEKLTCEYCNKCYIDKDRFANHLKMHEAVENGTHKCPHCNKHFCSAAIMKSHIETIHCPKESGSEESGVWKCKTCSMTFASKKTLTMHKRKHLKHPCEKCAKPFDDLKLLRRHLLEDHNIVASSPNKWSCEQCDVSFSKEWRLRDHQNRHTGEKPYICSTCNKSFQTYAAHWSHQKTHKSIGFHCDYCNKVFNNKGCLRKHVPLHQPPEDWEFHCDMCDLKFPSDQRFQKHLKKYKESHSRTCDVCGIKVLGLKKLIAHRRKKHNLFNIKK